MRWPKGPPHLVILNPPFFAFLVFIFYCSFSFFAFSRRTFSFSPPKRAFLVICQCLPLFILSLCFASPFSHYLFFSLSLSLSLSLFSFFLPSCLNFLLSFGSLFLSLSLFFFFGFCDMKRTTSKCPITKFVFINPFSCFGFLSCFLCQVPFSCLCFSPDYMLCFLFNTNSFKFQKGKSKNTHFWSRWGLQHNGVLLQTCVLQNMKRYRFLGPFLGKVWLMFKSTIKKVFHSAHISKQKQNDHF